MAVGDNYTLSLYFENGTPVNLTVRPILLQVDRSLAIRFNNIDISNFTFNVSAG